MANNAHNVPRNGEWRKSVRSGPNGGNCVEFYPCGTENCVAVRSSKLPEGTVLHISKPAMREFLAAIKADMFKCLSPEVEVKIADEIVVRGRIGGGFVLSKVGKPDDAIEYDMGEQEAFVEGAKDREFDDMVAEMSTEVLAAA